MRLGGRAQAAIEVLSDMEKRKRPASEALKDWGLSHRFAGSGDRAAIGNLVYDVLRAKSLHSWRMGDDTAHAQVFSVLLSDWGNTWSQLSEAFAEDKFAPEMPDENLHKAFGENQPEKADDLIRANIPEWCQPSFEANFAEDWVSEAAALCARPPLDLRVNTLKADRTKVAKQLTKTGAVETAIARHGLRIAPGSGPSRLPNVQAEPAFQKGWFEVQDEGSQIVADLVFAQEGEQVLDFCAGAGGKTLALSAAMDNKGQLHAWDANKQRLAPIFERLKRAGTRNVQVHAADADLSPLVEKMDRVVVDAPCTGSGTWRRRPDAKWRLTQANLEERVREQEEVLSEAAPFVRPGGFLVYITCSVFPEENESQVYAFTEDNPQFEILSAGEVWQDLFGYDKPQPWSSDLKTITLTPASTNTDGFFFCVMQRSG